MSNNQINQQNINKNSDNSSNISVIPKFVNSYQETEYYTAKVVQFYESGVYSPHLLSVLLGISTDYVGMLVCRKYKIRPVDYHYKFSEKMVGTLASKGLYEGYLK